MFFLSFAFASDGSLRSALATANRANPDLAAARFGVLAAGEAIEQAHGGLRPDIKIALNLSQNIIAEEYKNSTNSFRNNSYGEVTAALVVRQNLYAGGALWGAIDLARMSLAAAMHDLRAAEQNVFASVVSVYVAYGRDKITERLRHQNIERLEKHLQAAQDAFALGLANGTDVAFAESRLASAVAEQQLAQGSLAAATADYERVVGSSPDTIIELPTFTVVTKIPKDETALLAHALRSPVIEAARARLTESEIRLRLAKAEHSPTISAGATLQHNDTGAAMRPDNRQSLILSGEFSIPLYQGGIVSGKVRQAHHNYNRQKQLLDAAERQAKKDATSAWHQYHAAIAQQEARKKAVKSAKLGLQGTATEYKLGSRSLLELLDSEQNLIQAEIGAVNSLADLYLAHYRLLATAGELTAVALNLRDPLSALTEAVQNNRNIDAAMRNTEPLSSQQPQ